MTWVCFYNFETIINFYILKKSENCKNNKWNKFLFKDSNGLKTPIGTLFYKAIKKLFVNGFVKKKHCNIHKKA